MLLISTSYIVDPPINNIIRQMLLLTCILTKPKRLEYINQWWDSWISNGGLQDFNHVFIVCSLPMKQGISAYIQIQIIIKWITIENVGDANAQLFLNTSSVESVVKYFSKVADLIQAVFKEHARDIAIGAFSEVRVLSNILPKTLYYGWLMWQYLLSSCAAWSSWPGSKSE